MYISIPLILLRRTLPSENLLSRKVRRRAASIKRLSQAQLPDMPSPTAYSYDSLLNNASSGDESDEGIMIYTAAPQSQASNDSLSSEDWAASVGVRVRALPVEAGMCMGCCCIVIL